MSSTVFESETNIPQEKRLTLWTPTESEKHKLIRISGKGEIDWAAIGSAIDEAQDFPTLRDYHDQLQLLRRYAQLRDGAIQTRNAISRYIFRIDLRRWDIKDRLISRGGSRASHKAFLPDLGLSKRDSQNLELKHSIGKEKGDAYFDECDKASKEATEAGLLRLVEVVRPPAPPLPVGKYRVMNADPAWHYEHTPGRINPPEAHYPTMSTPEICAFGEKIRPMAASNCTLLLWVPPCKLPDGLRVLEAWGFDYVTNWVWLKGGRDMGPYCNVVHELILIGKRGSGTPTTTDKKLIQSINSVQSVAKTKTHSEKPVVFHEIIETLWPGQKYVELFARNPDPKRKGWTYWGNEIDVD